jgi:hypothetical protein
MRKTGGTMAAILTLEKSIAPKLLRCLYIVALVLIVIGTALGVVRGVRRMTAPMPLPPPAMVQGVQNPAPPVAGQPMGPRMGQGMGQMTGPMRRGPRGFMRPRRMREPGWMRGLPPAAAGGLIVLFALLRGIIALFVVRVLAEMGLAVLSLKRD